jgi:pyrroloquinoline quinone biosynthesis protein B
MLAVVLGAAAGGGFPQWNSNAPACRRARYGDPAALPRTQASIAVSADEKRWFLLNASPDLRQQIQQTPVLHPNSGLRSSPIAGVVLSGGDVDAIAGLLVLRERHRLAVYSTRRIRDVLDANPVFNVLAPDMVERRSVDLERPVALSDADGADIGLEVELFSVPGKVPLYLEGTGYRPEVVEGEETVGVLVTDGKKRLYFIPGCARMTEALARRLDGADVVLFDGTLWADDEMIRAGIGTKTGARMGHMSVSGPQGVMARFETIYAKRRILIHINNSNPVLLDDSAERAAVKAAGWEVAWDGMEIRP